MKKALPLITLLAYVAAIIVCVANLIIGTPANLTAIIIFAVYMVGVIVLMFFTARLMAKKKADEKQMPEAPAEKEKVEEAPAAVEVEATPAEIVEEAPATAAQSNDDEVDVTKFAKSRYIRSYSSKLIQSEDELKGYYSIIKNAFMSYKKVSSIVSKEQERIRLGRSTIGVIKLRGKTIMLYLALDPAQLEGTMYVGEDASAMSKYADTPFLYRVNGPRKASRAARLIAMVAEKLEMEPTAEPANEDYIALLPYESDEALIAKGLITDTEAEKASV